MVSEAAVRRWAVGITGASGAVYGMTLVKELLARHIEVHLVISEAGWRVLKEELGWESTHRQQTLRERFGQELDEGRLVYHPQADIGASIASGSYRMEGMVVIPCSMGSLSSLATGASRNLLTRAADVALKEGRRLVLVPRETPLHAIHLENMLQLARLGVVILPAMPAFYNHPSSLDDMIHFVVGKVMDSMRLEHELYKRWGEPGDEA